MIDEFLNYLRTIDRSEQTISFYGKHLRELAEHLRPKGLSEAGKEDLEEYLLEARKRYSEGTIAAILSVFSRFYCWCCGEGYSSENPVQGLSASRPGAPTKPRWLSEEEQERLLNALKDPRDMAIIGLMLFGGLSLNEVAVLSLDDIRFAREGVFIRIGRGKACRTVYFEDPLAGTLRYWTTVNKSKYLFPNRYELPLGRRGIIFLISEYAKKTGIPDLSSQVLRNTFCKNMLDKGMSVENVASVVGYSKPEFLKRKFGVLQKKSHKQI